MLFHYKLPLEKGIALHLNNICRPYHGHHNNILSLSVLCLGVEKISKEIKHFHNMTYIAIPPTRTPALGVMKFTLVVDPSLVIITIHLVCMDYAPQ